MTYTIYSVEDDADIARIINMTLTKQGYQVTTFGDGASFRKAFQKQKPDMILLDLMLPDCSGMDLLQEIRKDSLNDEIEIMILSAKSQVINKVDGLDLGADDFLEKPFDLLELISRVNAKARRHLRSQRITIGNVSISLVTHIVTSDDKEVRLTQAEFNILYFLMSHADAIVSRDDIFKSLWGKESDYESRTVDVHINSLRTKLGKEGSRIVAVYGVGYRYLR
jgi:two-component system, OmpR family, alkaline phosphatase synthesis response regulator PhoP